MPAKHQETDTSHTMSSYHRLTNSSSLAFSFPSLLINEIILRLSTTFVKCYTCYLCKKNANECILFSFTCARIKLNFSVEVVQEL